MNRPKVNYTMTWDCTFNIDGKNEEICFMTDDFEEVFSEYQALKKQHKSVVFVKHELHTKGRFVLSQEMIGVPVPEPILDAEAPMTPQRVRNAINRGEIRQEPPWMEAHNADIARHMLREPPQDRI